MAGIAAIALSSDKVADVANQHQGRRLGKRIQKHRCWVQNDQYLAFLDLLKSAYRRIIEADSILEAVAVKRTWWDGKMLLQPWEVGEPKIGHHNLFVLDRFDHIFGCL